MGSTACVFLYLKVIITHWTLRLQLLWSIILSYCEIRGVGVGNNISLNLHPVLFNPFRLLLKLTPTVASWIHQLYNCVLVIFVKPNWCNKKTHIFKRKLSPSPVLNYPLHFFMLGLQELCCRKGM